MGVTPGYKYTEVGVIPDDWEVFCLGECLTGTPDYGINASAVPYADGLPQYIRITDITDDGRYSRDDVVSVEASEFARYLLKPGELVFARTGASVGKSYLYNSSDGDLVFAGYLIRVKPNSDKLDPRFLAACVTIERYWNWVKMMSTRTGQPGINGTEFATLPIPLPPLPEQRAIAAALSDVDGLLSGLERLIAKKRAIKQAAMQQLLTGKTRLPGFSGEWQVKRLGELFEITSSKRVFQSEWKSEGIPFYRARELAVLGETGRVDNILFITKSLYESFKNAHGVPEVGDMLVTGVGTLGKVYVVADRQEFYFKDGNIIWFKIGGKISAEFLRQLYLTKIVMKQITDASAGTTVGTYTISGAKKTEIPLPPVPEQIAIAAVLSDMDAEIAALEQRRDKSRLLKQGMMQQLLTGRIRLTNPKGMNP